MGNGQSTTKKVIGGRGFLDPEKVQDLSFLEDGQFAKVYKGHMATSSGSKQTVSIKVPRVPDAIRKDKRKTFTLMATLTRFILDFGAFVGQVKTHIEEVRHLLQLTKRSGINKGIHLVKYLGVSYDDFRKEVWVRSFKGILHGNLASLL